MRTDGRSTAFPAGVLSWLGFHLTEAGAEWLSLSRAASSKEIPDTHSGVRQSGFATYCVNFVFSFPHLQTMAIVISTVIGLL